MIKINEISLVYFFLPIAYAMGDLMGLRPNPLFSHEIINQLYKVYSNKKEGKIINGNIRRNSCESLSGTIRNR